MSPRLLFSAALLMCAALRAEQVLLEPISKLQLHNVKAQLVSYRGRQAVRISDTAPDSAGDDARLAVLSGMNFQDGTIEIDLAGDTQTGAGPEYRGFTGLAFRVSPNGSRYECFYLRPKNGRSLDQAQRNHSLQYISIPESPWQLLREKFPGQYESYADLETGQWTGVKIEVEGDHARLFVNGSTQPVLIVNDLKHGMEPGAIALWIGPKTVAHFSNLRVAGAKKH